MIEMHYANKPSLESLQKLHQQKLSSLSTYMIRGQKAIIAGNQQWKRPQQLLSHYWVCHFQEYSFQGQTTEEYSTQKILATMLDLYWYKWHLIQLLSLVAAFLE